MTIIDLARQTQLPYPTTPIAPFIRRVKVGPFTPDAGLLSAFPGLDESGRPIVSIIGLRDDSGATYQRLTNLSDIDIIEQSFYWDSTAQELTIHLPPTVNPLTEVFFYGIAQGFTDSRVVYVNDVAYEPLATSVPAIRQQQDIENYDKLSFITGTIKLNNAGGKLDELIPQPVYGNDVIIYNLPDTPGVENYETSDLTRTATLFVEDYDIGVQEMDLRIQDRRKSQNISVPSERFDSATYPDIDDQLPGTVIPVLWGQAREIPAIVVNSQETDTSVNVKYRAALLLTALGTVQVDIDGEWTSATPLNIDLATGYFELAQSEARDPSNDNIRDVKLVAPTGITITRITDIIKDANERFANVDYTVSNYDLTEWAAEETSISTGAYYLDSEKKLFEMIRDLQNGANVGFRYEINAAGQRTIRVDDETRTPVDYIPNIIVRNTNNIRVKTDSSTLAAEVVIAWNKSHVSGKYFRLIDNSESDTVFDTYNQRPRREYQTVLYSEAHAQARADYVTNRFSTVRGIAEFELMCADRPELLALRIYDILDIEITPARFVDRDNDSIIGREFYGIKRVKILSVAPNTTTATNTITAVIIGDA